MPPNDPRGRNNSSSSTSSNVSFNSNITTQVITSNSGSTGPTGTFITSQIIDGICEGPIEGWPTNNIYNHIYLDGTPVKSYSNSNNTQALQVEYKFGLSDQTPLSNYTLIGSVKAPNYQGEIKDILDSGGLNNRIIQEVQIRDDTDGAFPPVEAVSFTFSFPEGVFRYTNSGGRDSSSAAITIEMTPFSSGTSGWQTVVDDPYTQEITKAFEVTYVIEIPPGWTVPRNLQGYSPTYLVDDTILFRISKSKEDLGNSRAHSKLYLKSFSTYTRNQYSHPYTALVGITIDSKNFDGSIPRRQYDLKLLKVKVPSNYNLVIDDRTGEVLERNYVGSWDGNFKEGFHWTDNPVWCFYDLITNSRYGLGKFIDPTILNKWKLYEIAKYCDAVVSDTRITYPDGDLVGQNVPSNSYTFSIPNNLGGVSAAVGSGAIKEPRFTCNAMISTREEAYSVVQRFASLFRSIVYFQSGGLQLIQDRPSLPIHLYNNTNVIGGVFSYQSSSIKARHTVAIVKWVDPKDLYSEKLEYVEDYDGIARYGYREIEIDGFGCTSRGQARRIGRHILITEKFELETVSFKTGIEGAVTTPGSLIKIKDSNRQTERAGGRIVSATSTSITLDKAINIPAGASSISLWVQTSTALNESIEGNSFETYRPTLTSHSITAGAGSSNLTTLTISSGTFSTTPESGNLWILSYIPSGSTENISVYKIISVVENNSFEYEITALEHYSNKYDAIEAYEPIPSYKPTPLKLHIPGPEEGFVQSVYNGKTFSIKISWRSPRLLSGTKYKLEVIRGSTIDTYTIVGDTSYTVENAPFGIYYFKIYALNEFAKQSSEPLLLGPYKLTLSMAENSFSSFSQNKFGADYITNSWKENVFPNSSIKYELWQSQSNSLRTFATTANIKNIFYDTNKISLFSFDQTSINTATDYWVEVPLLPYPKYTAVNITPSVTNSTNILLRTLEKPFISIGDKVFNSTRNFTSNVVSISQVQDASKKWVSTITVTPPVTSQATGDVIYFYKGIMGSSYLEYQPSAAIKQRTILAGAGTSSTSITGDFTNILTGDLIINKTRNRLGSIVTKVNNQQITTSNIPLQSSGDVIAFYQKTARESRQLKKFKIDYLYPAYLGDNVNILNFDDPALTPVYFNSIMVNITKGYCQEVVSVKSTNTGILEINAVPRYSDLAALTQLSDGDEVIFIDSDEVFSSSRNTHIHPVVGVASAGTNSTTVFCTGLFTNAKAGDILVNATRNTSRVILTKNSNNQVTLSGYLSSLSSSLDPLKIINQAPGDLVFYTSISSFIENLSYIHPPILTADVGTTSSTVNITTTGFAGISTSYKFYNMTRNTVASVNSVIDTDSITVSPSISNQQSGDRCYVFLPNTVTTTKVSAPDGAFSMAKPGDTFYNVTRNKYSTIRNVVSLTGDIDKKIDTLTLSSAIADQSVGDSFEILKGFISSQILSKENNGSDDIIELETIRGLDIGSRVNIYKMNASPIGSTVGTTITDTGLSPSTTYYYWMRATSNDFPFITGGWYPSETTGDPATTTIGIDGGNYNTSNDNDGSAISPNSITPIAPFIDLPPGGVNKDSTANIRLYWEWTGVPNKIDGFAVYFWSSNGESDDATIDADEDYSQATSIFSLPVNPRLTISSLSYVGSTVTASTLRRHKFSNGTKVKILNAKITSGTVMPGVNTESSPADFVTVTVTSPKGFTYTAPSTPSGTYSPNTGAATSCLYAHQIDNLTANYYYNAWIQPYRQVNTAISENGIIVGSPRILFTSP